MDDEHPLRCIKDDESKTEPWYKDGLKFSCTQCGKCCTGRPGVTWVSLDEIEAIANHLQISLNEVVRKYLRKIEGNWALLENPSNYDCVFLKGNKCSIYSVRPKQCQTFPFWKENLQSKEAWVAVQKRCEGISENAENHTLKEIKALEA